MSRLCLQGVEQSDHRQAAWPLSPAQEHKYDAVAAFDAGHLQEAQHAFDLSVWSELRNDKGMFAPFNPSSAAVHPVGPHMCRSS